MVSEQFYLDSTSIEERLINSENDLENRLDFKKQLNFNLVINNAQSKSSEMVEIISSTVASPITFTQYNKLIETYLYTLMQSSFITELDESKLSCHYQRKKKLFNPNKLIPGLNYLEELVYGNQLVWGGKYGSLGYYNYLSLDKTHYQNPSQVLHRSILECLNRARGLVEDTQVEFLSKIENLLLSDSQAADVDLYNVSYEFIEHWDLKEIVNIISELPSWLSNLIANYKSEPYTFNTVNSSEHYAAITLNAIAVDCFRLGIDDSNISSNLTYEFLHQIISPVYFSLIENIYSTRKKTLYRQEESTFTEAEVTLDKLLDILKLDNRYADIREKSFYILNTLFPLGGLNELLVLLSASLLLRIYILSHVSNNQFKNIEIYPYKTNLLGATELYGRCNKLAYMSGYLLKKTSINYLNVIGNNLIALSNLYDAGELEQTKIFELTR